MWNACWFQQLATSLISAGSAKMRTPWSAPPALSFAATMMLPLPLRQVAFGTAVTNEATTGPSNAVALLLTICWITAPPPAR